MVIREISFWLSSFKKLSLSTIFVYLTLLSVLSFFISTPLLFVNFTLTTYIFAAGVAQHTDYKHLHVAFLSYCYYALNAGFCQHIVDYIGGRKSLPRCPARQSGRFEGS